MHNQKYQPIIKALLKRRRGRPRKSEGEQVDLRRAALVVYAWSKEPGRFKNRREVIKYLQGMAFSWRLASEKMENPNAKDLLEELFRTFPQQHLEQSVSRGMNANNGQLKVLERLAKKKNQVFCK